MIAVPDNGLPTIALVQRELDAVADLPPSLAARRWGAALLATGRAKEAIAVFDAALADASASERGTLLVLQAYAHEGAGDPERALRYYLDGVREDGWLIGEVAARAHVLLDSSRADVLGPWLVGAWAESVRSALADERAESGTHAAQARQLRAQLEVLVAHVHAMRSEHAKAVAALRAATEASAEEVASFADELPGWFGESLTEADAGASLYLLLAELDLLLERPAAALTYVDKALASGGLTDADHPYGDTQAHELRARVLFALGRNAEAADALFTAAQQSTWVPDWAHADSLLAELAEIDRERQAVWWLRALVRTVESGADADDPARADVAKLHEALEFWETGYRLGPPAADSLWAYNLRADIHMSLASVSIVDEPEQRWLGVLYGERGVAPCDDDDNLAWRYHNRGYRLIYNHRSLGHMVTALRLADECLARWPVNEESGPDVDDDCLAAERAVVRIYTGHPAEALEVLAEIERHEHPAGTFTGGWFHHVRGLALTMSGEFEGARAALEKALEESPEHPSVLGTMAACCVRQGDRDAVRVYCERLLQLTEPGRPGAAGHLDDRAITLLRLGRYEEAAAILLEFAGSGWRSAATQSWVDVYLGACRLAAGEPDAEMTLRQAATHVPSAWQALLMADDVAAIVAGQPRGSGAAGLSALFARRAAEITERDVSLANAEAELTWGREEPAPALVRVATTAAIGRTRFAAGNLTGAARSYAELLAEDDLFPEAPGFYLRAIDGLLTAALREDRLSEAAELAEDGFARLTAVADRRPGGVRPRHLAVLAAGASLARLRLGEHGAALTHFDRALRGYADAGQPSPELAVGRSWLGWIDSPAAYWDMADHGQRCLAETTDGADALRTVLTECQRYLEELFGFPADPVRPEYPYSVEVTVGPGLAPEVTNERVISAGAVLRARIRERIGIIMPGVWFTDDSSLPPECVVVKIMGSPRLRVDTIERDPDGEFGALTPVFDIVERGLEQYLPEVAATQDVYAAAEAWATEHDARALLDSALPDAERRLRFGVLVRRLLALGMPVSWPDVLRVAESTALRPDALDAAVRMLRDPEQIDESRQQPASPGPDGDASTEQDNLPAEEPDVPVSVLPIEPVPTGVVLAFTGASGLSSSLLTEVVANVTSAVKALADTYGLRVADPVVALTEPLPDERQYASEVRVVVNGEVCHYPPALATAAKTYLLGFAHPEFISMLVPGCGSLIAGPDPEQAETAERILGHYLGVITFFALGLKPSVLLRQWAQADGDEERTLRRMLDLGMRIDSAAEQTTTDGKLGEWEVLVDPGYLREMSLTTPVTTHEYTALGSVFKPLAAEVGIPLPSFRLTPAEVGEGCVQVRINHSRGVPYRTIPADKVFAYGVTAVDGFDGTACVEPLFGGSGLMLPAEAAAVLDARQQGYMKPLNYLLSVVLWSVRDHADRLISQARVDDAVAALRQTQPIQHELVTGRLAPRTLREALRALAEEGVPVNSLSALIDLVLEYELCPQDNPDRLAWLRGRMRETIGAAVATGFRATDAGLLPPRADDAAATWESSGRTDFAARDELLEILHTDGLLDTTRPLLVPHGSRRAIFEALHTRAPDLRVLAFTDLPGDFTVNCMVPVPTVLRERVIPDGPVPASVEPGIEADSAAVDAWATSQTWEASAAALREHVGRLSQPGCEVLFCQKYDASAWRHRAILRLTRQLPIDDIANLLTSGTAAARAALDAADAGDLDRFTLLLLAAPGVMAPVTMLAFITAVLVHSTGNAPAARAIMAYVTENASEADNVRYASIMRSFGPS